MSIKDLKSKLLTKVSPSRKLKKKEACSQSPLVTYIVQMEDSAKDGKPSYRFIALAGGVVVMITSLFSIVYSILEANVMKTFTYANIFNFGLLICILELRFLNDNEHFNSLKEIITKAFPFVKSLWGRGWLYIFVAVFQLSHFSPMNAVSGLYLIGVGIMFVGIGTRAKCRLSKLKSMLDDDQVLKKEFNRYDVDNDGALNKKEFAELITGLTGSDINGDDLEAAFGMVDIDSQGVVTEDKFRAWWIEFEEDSRDSSFVSV